MNKIYKTMLAAAGTLALLAAIPAVSKAAPTVDQLTAPNMQYYAVTWSGYKMGNCIEYINTPIKIEKVSNTQVILRNFYLESNTETYDLPASYNPSTGRLTIADETLFYRQGTTSQVNLYILGTTTSWRYKYGSGGYDWYPGYSYSAISGTFTEMSSVPGAYEVILSNYGIENSYGDHKYFGQIKIVAYPAEYDVTEIKHSGNDTGKRRDYKVGIVFNEDGKHFNIINFTNEGCGYDNYNYDYDGAYTRYNVFIDGILNDDGTVTLGNSDACRYAFTWDQYLVTRNSSGYLSGYNNVKRYNYAGFPKGYSNSTNSSTISGVWGRGIDPYHMNYGAGWSKNVNGGTCETRVGLTMKFNDFGAVINGGSTRFDDWYQNTIITGADSRDVTFDAAISGISIKHDPNNDFTDDGKGNKVGFYRISANVSNWQNIEHVDRVELYCVEGPHNHCSTVDHSKNVLIGETKNLSGTWSPDEVIVYPTVTKDKDGKIIKINKDFSFYLKAHYKNGSSAVAGVKTAATLDPTYHALVAANANDITTAVDLHEATGLNVEDVEGGIIVHAEGDAAVQVYNMAGMLVATGNTNETIAIDATGVMVVRVNGKVFKIMK